MSALRNFSRQDIPLLIKPRTWQRPEYTTISKPNHIRLLVIERGIGYDQVQCYLIDGNLEDPNLKFKSLSDPLGRGVGTPFRPLPRSYQWS
jgi:hypothetical protein